MGRKSAQPSRGALPKVDNNGGRKEKNSRSKTAPGSPIKKFLRPSFCRQDKGRLRDSNLQTQARRLPTNAAGGDMCAPASCQKSKAARSKPTLREVCCSRKSDTQAQGKQGPALRHIPVRGATDPQRSATLTGNHPFVPGCPPCRRSGRDGRCRMLCACGTLKRSRATPGDIRHEHGTRLWHPFQNWARLPTKKRPDGLFCASGQAKNDALQQTHRQIAASACHLWWAARPLGGF